MSDRVKQLAGSFHESVNGFDRSPFFTVVESFPDRHGITILVFVSDELLVIESSPRRHGREKGVHIHLGHGGLGKSHDGLNVFRLNVNIKLSIDVGQEEGSKRHEFFT